MTTATETMTTPQRAIANRERVRELENIRFSFTNAVAELRRLRRQSLFYVEVARPNEPARDVWVEPGEVMERAREWDWTMEDDGTVLNEHGEPVTERELQEVAETIAYGR